jgi:hypothetical protein
MIDLESRQERFMRHPQERRLGNLSTNLNRIALYSDQNADPEEIRYFIRETKYLTEWASIDASLEIQVQLAEIQRDLARWTIHWDSTWNDSRNLERMKSDSRAWSEKVLGWANLTRWSAQGSTQPPEVRTR